MFKLKRILIFAHGDTPSANTCESLAAAHDVIIATDGAVYRCADVGVAPDFMTGDMDSARLPEARKLFPEMRIVPTPDQERGDLEKAMRFAADMGATHITVVGAMGGRIDHSLANLSLLQVFGADRDVCFADDFGTMRLVSAGPSGDKWLSFPVTHGDTVSLISDTPESVVTIKGVKWELIRATIKPGTHGVSNLAVSDTVTLIVHSGSVYLCCLDGRHVSEQSRLRSIEAGAGHGLPAEK